MAAPKGNRYWEKRDKAGRELKYTPDELWAKALEYFKWADNNPWKRNEPIKSGELAGKTMPVEIQRPYTLIAFCSFALISKPTFNQYEEKQDFLSVCGHIREVINNQKFEGAAVGAFNAAIIARDLGLVDKQDVTSKGESISKHVVEFKDFSKPKKTA